MTKAKPLKKERKPPTTKGGAMTVNVVRELNVLTDRALTKTVSRSIIDHSIQRVVEDHLIATQQRVFDVAETAGTDALLVLHILMKRSLETFEANPTDLAARDFAFHVATALVPYTYRPVPEVRFSGGVEGSATNVDEGGAKIITLKLEA